MSKDNRFVPPAIKRDSRPNNSVVPHRRRKRSNAQRHGVFAEPLILPGEDPGEFKALHAALIAEWTPSGPSEESKVFSIADAEWRKLRSRRFAEAKAISNSMRPDHPAFDEARGLIVFGIRICHEPETAFPLSERKFPRQSFESIAEWTAAVLEEIKSGLLPGTPGFAALDPESALMSAIGTKRAAR